MIGCQFDDRLLYSAKVLFIVNREKVFRKYEFSNGMLASNGLVHGKEK